MKHFQYFILFLTVLEFVLGCIPVKQAFYYLSNNPSPIIYLLAFPF
jgi:hypothetical protein